MCGEGVLLLFVAMGGYSKFSWKMENYDGRANQWEEIGFTIPQSL